MDATKTLVHSLFSLWLDYCNSVLAGLPNTEVRQLQCIQNTMACLTTRCHKYDHITPVLSDLHWLPIKERIICKVLVLTYKAIHDLAPPYLKSLLVPHVPGCLLCSSSKPTLVVPKCHTKLYRARAFSHFAPVEYKKLPIMIDKVKMLSIFKSRLKTHLFRIAYSFVAFISMLIISLCAYVFLLQASC